MSLFRKLLKHVPGVGPVLDVEAYSKGELGDAVMFGYRASLAGYMAGTHDAIKHLRKVGTNWCLLHGCPSMNDVKEELDL